MTRAGITDSERARRIRIAQEVELAGGNGTEFGRRAGLQAAAAIKWLQRNAPDLHRQLTSQGRGPTADLDATLARLRQIQAVAHIKGGRARLAKALGISHAALSRFERIWAPDGIDAAIADLADLPENGESLNPRFARLVPIVVHEVAHG